MANQALIPLDVHVRYEVQEGRNGLAILAAAHPDEWQDILQVLCDFALLRSEILNPGSRKSTIADKLDGHFLRLGWREEGFDARIVVDNVEHVAPTHKVDCYKNRVALEVEWNTRTRSTTATSTTFACCSNRAIDAGVITTRCTELQMILDRLGRAPSYGSSTTHMARLRARLDGGSGGGCPVVVLGIRGACYVED